LVSYYCGYLYGNKSFAENLSDNDVKRYLIHLFNIYDVKYNLTAIDNNIDISSEQKQLLPLYKYVFDRKNKGSDYFDNPDDNKNGYDNFCEFFSFSYYDFLIYHTWVEKIMTEGK
jgi:hypothetical protein